MSDSSLPDLCPYCGGDKSNRRSALSGVADTTRLTAIRDAVKKLPRYEGVRAITSGNGSGGFATLDHQPATVSLARVFEAIDAAMSSSGSPEITSKPDDAKRLPPEGASKRNPLMLDCRPGVYEFAPDGTSVLCLSAGRSSVVGIHEHDIAALTEIIADFRVETLARQSSSPPSPERTTLCECGHAKEFHRGGSGEWCSPCPCTEYRPSVPPAPSEEQRHAQ